MSWIDDILQWSRAKAAAAANAYPETAEQLARWYQGDDVVDMVKFLYEKEPGLDGKIEKARQDPMFAKIYETVYQSTQAHIAQQVQANLPEAWMQAARKAGISVDALKAQMEQNGAEKIAFAVTSSVRSEIESMGWYTGRIAGDTFRKARDAVWKTPEKDILEDPLGWIYTMVGNVFNLISELASTKRTDLEQRGEQYVAADTAARAEEIVAKMGQILHVEHQMPATFIAADAIMVGVYEQLKQKADPAFHLDEAGKTQLRTKFLAQLQSAEAVPPPQPQQPPQTVPSKPERSGYSGDDIGLPGIASDGEAAKAVKAEGPHGLLTRFLRHEGEFQPSHPELPELASLDNASLQKLGINAFDALNPFNRNASLGGSILAMAPHMMLASTDEEMFNIFQRYVPDATREMDGEHIIVNARGLRFYLNKPGISMRDVDSAGPLAMTLAAAFVTGGAVSAFTGGASLGTIGTLATYATAGGLSYAGNAALSEWANGYDDASLGEIFFSLVKGAAFGPLGAKMMGAAKAPWGSILRKAANKQSLTTAEETIVRTAGIEPDRLPGIVVEMAKSKGVTLAAGTAGGTLAAGSAAAGEAIPHEDVPPGAPVKPGTTPGRESPGGGYDMSFPPML